MKTTFIAKIARTIQARQTSIERNNQEWITNHTKKLDEYNLLLPSGSGLDVGCNIDYDNSTFERVVICTAFHHMDENGYYNGWTDHRIIVKPEFDGIKIIISGKDRDHKDYLHEVFENCLMSEMDL